MAESSCKLCVSEGKTFSTEDDADYYKHIEETHAAPKQAPDEDRGPGILDEDAPADLSDTDREIDLVMEDDAPAEEPPTQRKR